MRRFLFVFLALAALALPATAGAASCRTADSCKSLEHDATANAAKTINVDAAGAVLVGGSGSRVELLYSGTTTDVTGGAGVWVVDRAAFTPPAWCKTVSFFGRIRAITIGPGASLSYAAFREDANGVLTTSAGASRGIETTAVVTPTINTGVNINVGFDVGDLNTAPLAGVSTRNHPVFPGPKIGLSHNWATAPTSWTLDWSVYCSG